MQPLTVGLSSGKVLFRRSHIRDVAVKRLKHLDNYCKVRPGDRLPPNVLDSVPVLRHDSH